MKRSHCHCTGRRPVRCRAAPERRVPEWKPPLLQACTRSQNPQRVALTSLVSLARSALLSESTETACLLRTELSLCRRAAAVYAYPRQHTLLHFLWYVQPGRILVTV
jgi:hypothetical protein